MEKLHGDTQAPDFTLEDVQGNKISLSDFSGKKNVTWFLIEASCDPSVVSIWRSCVRIIRSL
ncbi:MAG: redoxin domain-containing protein [Chloroflexota bacterium]|nr:redoxin domain-containing protein [Chloroflexota bacterium]